MRLLFLDFDGVLHPTDAIHHREHDSGSTRITGDRLFRHAPQLYALLEDHLDVAVVISSDWRLSQPLEDLRERLGALGGRVVGTTSYTALPGMAEYSLEVSGLTRYRQCERLANHFGVDDWRLIDDHVEIVFGPERATPEMMRRVVFCDPIMGLDTWITVGRLEKWLVD